MYFSECFYHYLYNRGDPITQSVITLTWIYTTVHVCGSICYQCMLNCELQTQVTLDYVVETDTRNLLLLFKLILTLVIRGIFSSA